MTEKGGKSVCGGGGCNSREIEKEGGIERQIDRR